VTVEHLMAGHSLSACGIDTSRTLLGSGRARNEHLPLLRATAEHLPLADASVDVVLAECVLSLLDDADRGLAEFARVLRPAGMLVLGDIYVRKTGSGPAGGRPVGLPCARGAMTEVELAKRLRASGFRIRHWEDHSDELTRLAVQLLWQTGSTRSLWCSPVPSPGTGAAAGGEARPAKPGYFLLLADHVADHVRG